MTAGLDKTHNDELPYLLEEIAKLKHENQELMAGKELAETFTKRKSEFLANMSHELRTPMHAILSFSKISLKKLGIIERHKLMNNLRIIYESGERLLHTLNDILDISKLESEQMHFEFQNASLTDEIEAVIRELQSLFLDNGLRYEIVDNTSNPSAEFDPHRIGQVLQNVIGNAIKFSPTEGKIKITIANTLDNNQEHLRVSICDEGIGIPKDELESIFNKYVQSGVQSDNIGGTGLGLSIARQIIHRHNGLLWAERNSDQGSTFHFTIPKTQNGDTSCSNQ